MGDDLIERYPAGLRAAPAAPRAADEGGPGHRDVSLLP
jgi:hypothetical protein